jgi:hypothetical protein
MTATVGAAPGRFVTTGRLERSSPPAGHLGLRGCPLDLHVLHDRCRFDHRLHNLDRRLRPMGVACMRLGAGRRKRERRDQKGSHGQQARKELLNRHADHLAAIFSASHVEIKTHVAARLRLSVAQGDAECRTSVAGLHQTYRTPLHPAKHGIARAV